MSLNQQTFQKVINEYPSIGVQGDIVSLNTVVYTPFNYKADGDVVIGTFVWLTGGGLASNAGAADVQPLGLPTRVINYYDYNLASSGTLIALSGSPLTVMQKGVMWVTTLTAATVGQKVFAVLANGTIKTGAKGATIAGAIETEFSVETAGAVNDLIAITNWTEINVKP